MKIGPAVPSLLLAVVLVPAWLVVDRDTGSAQLAERADDPLGFAIREPRLRLPHSPDPTRAGSSMYLLRTDPWLAYRRGSSYFHREWRQQHGVFSHLPNRPVAASANSCGMCHNLPFRSAGAGGNAVEPVGPGRNTPHLFGAGLMEILGEQIRRQILAAYDENGNGFLDVPAETAGRRAVVEAVPGVRIDFGSLADRDGDGEPDLNEAIIPLPVDGAGRALLTGDDPRAAGYDLAVGLFSVSLSDHQAASLRQFSVGVFNSVFGMEVEDPMPRMPTTPASGGPAGERRTGHWAATSIAGARQLRLPATATAPSAQAVTAGELDLLEWYLLNHPAPAVGPQDGATRRGRRLLETMGCASCHVPDWQIQPADPRGLPGDRRFFHLEVAYNPQRGRLQGRLVPLWTEVATADGGTLRVPRRDGFRVRGIYTDLLHHDIGERFYDYSYEEGKLRVATRFRTAPLWGIGSTAPYGHDGRSLTLDDVIRRHGGEAAASAAAYARSRRRDREALLSFLHSLVLYQPETLPTDLDGDGRIATDFRVRGLEAGPERFQPELLFRVAPRYRGWITRPDGERFFSYELLNAREAYDIAQKR